MSTVITFAADNDLFRKRKRVYRACDACKKRRKRCDHTFAEEEKNNPTSSQPGAKSADKSGSVNDGSTNVSGSTIDQAQEDDNENVIIEGMQERHSPGSKSTNSLSRFIGDMTPESVLRGRNQERGIGGPSQSQIGYFVSSRDKELEPNEHNGGIESAGLSITPTKQQRKMRIQIALESYLQALDVSILPPSGDTDMLLEIYFSSVHPLLPIINEDIFMAEYKAGAVPKVLVQAVCLVASRHDAARPHLRLENETETVLEPKEFSDRLYSSVVAALNARLETEKLILIQVNALLSINREISAEHDDNSVHLAKAVQYAHSLGLHLGRARKEHRDEWMEKLFWCLWGLDKLANGSINARPTQLKEADIGLTNMMNMKKYRHTAFGMWLRLCTYLEKIITFYRPSADPTSTGWEEDFPAFEDIVGPGGDKLQNEAITLLELLYHCVAMLSCRSRSIDGPARSTPSYVRASLSAVRVISIMESPSARNLPPLPVPDWSLALSMSFAYRQYRQSRLTMHKARAKEDLEKCCNILDGLKTVWHSAGIMAEMGKAAIDKANKVSRATTIGKTNTDRQYTTVKQSGVQPQESNDNVSNFRHNLSNDNGTAFREQHMRDPVPLESPSSVPGQHLISGNGGAAVTGYGSQPASSGGNITYDGVFDDIDAVLGSYPDLNFPMDFTDALASLDDANVHTGSNALFLG